MKKQDTEQYRDIVINRIESHFGVSLSQVIGRRKWLKDNRGRKFWVLVGSKTWHGIPEEMMDSEIHNPSNGVLVIAKIDNKISNVDISIYHCPLEAFVKNRNKLSRARRGNNDYQFTYKEERGMAIVNQESTIALHKLPVNL